MHASAAVGHHGYVWVRAFGLACLLTALWMSLASAQTRRAAIRVNATVLDAAASDVLGAHALAAHGADAPLGAALDGDGWRITAGGSPALSLRAERLGPTGERGPGPRVAICEVAENAAAKCRNQQLPGLHVSSASRAGDLLVRFGRDAGAPVRLTLAYTGT
jgi:hypothetical protein